MDAFQNHTVIIGGPEEADELLAIVLDDGEAIPLFDSTEEAEEFLSSTGDFATGWRTKEVAADELLRLLEFQGEEVRYVAVSPPPERLEGGMEVQIIDRETFESLLETQASAPMREEPEERKSFWRRLLGR